MALTRKGPLLAERGVVGRDSVFKGELRLPHGKHLFRFFVDGVWCHDPKVYQPPLEPQSRFWGTNYLKF